MTDFMEADQHIFDCLRAGPVRLTTVLNRVARLFPCPKKRQRRAVQWAVLRRIGNLIRRGSLRRVRRVLVCLPDYRPAAKLPACVIHLLARAGGSTGARKKCVPSVTTSTVTVSASWDGSTVPAKPKPLDLNKPVVLEPEAVPTPKEISRAASALASLPRTRRPLSGWIQGRRLRRLTPVITPSWGVMPAYFVRRNKVYVLLPDEPRFAGRIFERFDATEVRLYRSPHAQLLGRLKKGCKEAPSAAKKQSSPVNGCKPPRPGSRARGRPRAVRQAGTLGCPIPAGCGTA